MVRVSQMFPFQANGAPGPAVWALRTPLFQGFRGFAPLFTRVGGGVLPAKTAIPAAKASKRGLS